MLTEKEKKTLARLQEDLAMPRWKYILIYGLTFGILMAIVSAFTDVLIDHYTVSEVLNKRIWIGLAIAPFSGLLFGMIIRWLTIKRLVKLKLKEKEYSS